MTTLPELPPKYYLGHFLELLEILRAYDHLLEEDHRRFLQDFESLSEEAQCAYVRMVNRKGNLFFRSRFKYEEITGLGSALQELNDRAFLRPLTREDLPALLHMLTKSKLSKLAPREFVTKGLSKPQLAELCLEHIQSLEEVGEELLSDIFVQGRQAEISYLFFLYFGKIQDNLTLYTLRDLGIKRINSKQEFNSRFESKEETLTHYFYTRLPLTDVIPPLETWPSPLNHESTLIKERMLVSLAEEKKQEGDLEGALKILKEAQLHPGREKRIRLLYQLQHLEECRRELEGILTDPQDEEEYLFAEDFMARKFHKKKVGILTETLRNASLIQVDESYFRKPEAGVIQYLKETGHRGHHAENYLWCSFFGIWFWHELYESEKSHVHNQFEAVPNDLISANFYDNHREEIEIKLNLLHDKAKAQQYLEHIITTKFDQLNGLFGWHPEMQELLSEFLDHADAEAVAHVLTYMAQDYNKRSTGFPDIMAIEDGKIAFYEVKAEGDSLKASQLKQIFALRKAGFKVEVLKVQYNVNPDQPYVVVDVETTGMMTGFNRITELGAVKIRNGEVIETFQSLINPERSIPLSIQQLTGITNEMVAEAPTFAEVADQFEEFTKDCIFVAHNVSFDYGFIQQEYARLERVFTRPYICTKAGMKKHYPGLESYGLKNLSTHFSVSLKNHHRALNDAQAAAGLLLLINEKRRSLIATANGGEPC